MAMQWSRKILNFLVWGANQINVAIASYLKCRYSDVLIFPKKFLSCALWNFVFVIYIYDFSQPKSVCSEEKWEAMSLQI